MSSVRLKLPKDDSWKSECYQKVLWFTNGFMKVKVKVKVIQLCLTLQPHRLYSPWNSPGQNIGVDALSLLQGLFPTQGLNPGLQHCRWILYQLSHKGSPRILEWVAIFLTQELNWGLLHCRWILYQLSYILLSNITQSTIVHLEKKPELTLAP